MKKILHIISSPRTAHSASRKLGNAIVEKLTAKYPGSTVSVRDLAKDPLPHLDEAHIASFFTPAENRTVEQLATIRYSEEAVEQLLEADTLVIEAPMYNFTITSTLKAYFDHITRAGITFKPRGQGLLPEGLLKDKEAYIVTSSGGVYSEGDLKNYDFVEPYVRSFLSVIGIRVAGVFRAEGQSLVGPEAALEKGFESIAAWE
ncbi:FMN-dependent NADH-azoreductase [Chitinophaga jiangningensis]|uniref:FMN dependent NADH:quinone oxidoreductase n=1 Tax=Chitinophaga jiangningensis TaxID=1419482 RepID=A0A1M7IYT4_9BACT|nr:NAD(P)H-dependent oxidoreductase [Chitinophaga jiangningensis]SHM45793.1 FMN-dependent NADH-azoreductase [Chitinophaga jiangningensis]